MSEDSIFVSSPPNEKLANVTEMVQFAKKSKGMMSMRENAVSVVQA